MTAKDRAAGRRLRRRLRTGLFAAFARVAPGLVLRYARPHGHDLGRVGEALAARWLTRRGARILARRLLTPMAEVDLLIEDGCGWACVEVKCGRVGARFRPGHRLDARRLRRLWHTARWLEPRARGRRVRVDLVEVCLEPDRRLRGLVQHRGLRAALGS